jgi:hypothetical protein
LTQALQSAASSTATKIAALEVLPPDEEPVLDLLEGVLSWGVPGEEPLLFRLLLMDVFIYGGNGNDNGATATAMIN